MADNATLRAVVYGRESEGKSKSVDDQVDLGVEVVDEHGWTLAGTFDDGTGASRYSTKPRPGWTALLAELAAGRADVLVLWESTRGTRQLSETAALLDVCRERGVLVYVVSDERLYDPRKSRDYADLARAGVDAGYETDKLSERVLRGIGKAARTGRPAHGKVPYGYRRRRWTERDPETGKLTSRIAQEPDPETAPVVRRVFAEVLRSVPLAAIARGLVDDGIAPPPRRNDGGTAAWTRDRVRDLVRREAYAGYRVHRRQGRNGNGRGELLAGGWEPIVTPEDWHAAQAVLDQPDRSTVRRPGKAVHLLSMIAECHNGHPLTVKKPGTSAARYVCRAGCGGARQAPLDELVEAAVVEALADPRIYGRLRQAGETTDREVQAARDEAAALRARLDDYRERARRGAIDADDFAAISAGLKADLAAADERAERVSLPPALRPFLTPGADVEARWDAATVQARREVIRALVTVTVRPAGRNPRADLAGRVDIEPRPSNAKVISER